MKIAVGMSGGVDSSVAALLLKEQGHEVLGVTMNIWKEMSGSGKKTNSCFAQSQGNRSEKIREISRIIGIKTIEFDLSSEFENTVLSYFKKEYLSGKTPNPCILCNEKIKFGLLSDKSEQKFGTEIFATGHYARIIYNERTSRYSLLKASDLLKDQSYFLYGLSQDRLKKTLYPLGKLLKGEVREIAKKKGLPSWSEPESQDFYSGDYSNLIEEAPHIGEIVDTRGTVLGHHEGIWNFTIGQRHGLRIAHSEPLYVVSIDPASNKIIVGTKKEAQNRSFFAKNFNWVSCDSLEGIEKPVVKVRAAHKGALCSVSTAGYGCIKIVLESPESGISAGQSAVIYEGDKVVGGGTIEYDR